MPKTGSPSSVHRFRAAGAWCQNRFVPVIPPLARRRSVLSNPFRARQSTVFVPPARVSNSLSFQSLHRVRAAGAWCQNLVVHVGPPVFVRPERVSKTARARRATVRAPPVRASKTGSSTSVHRFRAFGVWGQHRFVNVSRPFSRCRSVVPKMCSCQSTVLAPPERAAKTGS